MGDDLLIHSDLIVPTVVRASHGAGLALAELQPFGDEVSAPRVERIITHLPAQDTEKIDHVGGFGTGVNQRYQTPIDADSLMCIGSRVRRLHGRKARSTDGEVQRATGSLLARLIDDRRQV